MLGHDKKDVLPSMASVVAMRLKFAEAAQEVYDAWNQDKDGFDEVLGSGGICQDIADEIARILSSSGVDCAVVSQLVGEQHVYVVAKLEEGVFEIDIDPYLYESGSGYMWRKRAGVHFSEADIIINKISPNHSDFEMISDET